MAEKVTMKYFWGQDVQMTQFYRVPKALYTAEYFRKICFEAKAIYGMMIDRVGLSIKNQWLDDEGKTYICYSVADIMEDTGCKRGMVLKCLKELREIGLIETVKQGQGHPDIIYVKNFEFVEEEVRSTENEPQQISEVQKTDLKKREKQTSSGAENELLEVQKSNPNNTENNYININNTYPILSISERKVDGIDAMEEYQAYSEIIKENIEYDALCARYPYETEIVGGIFDLILETVISKKDSVLVSGQEYPAALVKSKFLKLNFSHIEYVIGCMGKNTTKVRNIKAYLLAALFNAGSTIGSYYKAEVNHDMPQFAG